MKFFPALLFIVLLSHSHAQSLANYSTVKNTGTTYLSVNASGSSFASWRNTGNNTQDDNRSDFTDIGFDFWYDGTRYTKFSISTNGFIDFSTSTADGGPAAGAFGYDNTAFTAANAANATRPAIAPFYDDLTAQGGTAALGISMKYVMTGAAPSRTLTIEWINMAVYQNTSPTLNFQVQLVESTGQILVNYGTMTAGTNTFSYSMGLNGPTVSNAPTAAQLKELQAANGSTFGNAVVNNLVTVPASNSQYIFTPPLPTAVSGALAFSGVAQTSMSLSWTNWASNEIGYVIYNSTDGINYDFVTQTAVNVITSAVTGLLPSTTYFWKVYAVTEGALSSALTGTQATTAAGNKISLATGNWSAAATWTPNGVPTAGDNVTIANGHLVSINNVNAACNNLIVGQGTSATLQFNGTAARLLNVSNDITVNAGASFLVNTTSNVTHSITVEGNVTNTGTLNFATDANSLANVIFSKDGNQTISGSGATTNFNRINLNLGTSIDNVLEIKSSNFSAASNFLDLLSGTLKVSTVNASTLTPFTAATTMSANTGIWLNSANATMSVNATLTLYGELTVSNGTLNIGNAANEDLVSTGGSIFISGGVLNVAGKLDGSTINNLCDFNISGGSFIVPTFGSSNTTIAPFHIAGAGSDCNMTGGSIIIVREGGTGAQNLGFTNIATSGAVVTGGTLQIGSTTTPAAQVISINTDSPVHNLLVNSANATASLVTNALVVKNNITISTGTLNAAGLGLSLGGNWSNSSLFTPGAGTVTFNGTAAQTLFKSGGETFNSILFTGSGAKSFLSPLTTSANFSVASGSSVDVSTSNFSLTVKGNFINSGTFNAQSGLVTLNGTAAQTIGGSSTTTFFNLTLNNTTGALLSNAENLKSTLTLNNGIFNVNSQVFTMLSDATNTARIAQITGTGNFSGNATIQRFAPGGLTGWAFLGSPMSSTLTLNDWDDNIYISCSSCPDGSASGFISIYTYSESVAGAYDGAASYIPMSTINDPLLPGVGYWVYLGDAQISTGDITLDLTGAPQKFAYAMPLKYTNNGTPTDDGWNFITNPYPSPISWALLKGSTTNVDNAIYVYNTDLNSGVGTFASYVNGVSSPAVGSGGQGDVIPLGQAFYVHATAAATLTAQEANKVATNTTFLRTSSTTNTQGLLRLKLKDNTTTVDETVLYFEPAAHDYFDLAYDSYKLRSQDPGAPSIALESGGNVFQINGVAPVSGNFSMPLKTLTGNSGTYTITADDLSSFPQGACINLYDNFTGSTTDLKTSDYVFTLSDTTSVARFMLNITINPLNITALVNQPTCALPIHGKITASGSSAGPWNYYWSSNGTPVKTSLNKSVADTLDNLSGGNFDLEINTVGMCDNNESSYTINEQTSAIAGFTSIDTLMLDHASTIQFNNTSVNAASSYWDFGTTHDFSTSESPAFSYLTPGNYTVSLIVTSASGCQDTLSKRITVVATELGLSQVSTSQRGFTVKTLDNNVYIMQADFAETINLGATLSDAAGRLLVNYGTSTNDHFNLQINLDTYNKGIYFLTLTSESGKKVVKLPVK